MKAYFEQIDALINESLGVETNEPLIFDYDYNDFDSFWKEVLKAQESGK